MFEKKPKKVTQGQGERIQKKLANLGFGSRREIERLILEGQVKVNNKKAIIGQMLIGNELVQVRNRKVVLNNLKSEKKDKVIAYHKPVGTICTRRDEKKRPTVFDRLPSVKNARWVMIGRLDINTQGLLLFTTNGHLANKLMHPSNEIEREYMVRVFGRVDEDKLISLQNGVMLEDGEAKFSKIIPINDLNESVNSFFKVTIKEGRNREVRRLWEAVGCQVSRLKRVRYGSYELPKTLKQNHTIELTALEIKALTSL